MGIAIFFVAFLIRPISLRAEMKQNLFDKSNLVAWCIVPFDTKKRGPEERAAMLEKLGIKKLAYDWRAEHIPTFDAEVAAMKKHGVEMTAWWCPGALNDTARTILDCIKRNDIHPQLWVTMEGGPHLRLEQAFEATPEAQAAHVRRIANAVKPLAAEAEKLGCKVALYNHGGWFGVPENQIEVVELLKSEGVENVGMVYTQHHGHGEIARFEQLFPKMQPHLLAVTLNGMIQDGDLQGHNRGTIPIGQGDQDLRLLGIIKNSGWKGPVGIIVEVMTDAEVRLRDNLEGLAWIDAQLDGQTAGPRPVPKSWKDPETEPKSTEKSKPEFAPAESAAFGKALDGGMVVDGKDEYRGRPITVECRAKLDSSGGFNILVASDPKKSSEHWELYSYVGTGNFSVFQPGMGGVFQSDVNICDGKWHNLAAVLGTDEVVLFVDGQEVLRRATGEVQGTPSPGSLGIGRLAEGGIGCNGLIDAVRISRGKREISSTQQALEKDDQTVDFWNFDDKK